MVVGDTKKANSVGQVAKGIGIAAGIVIGGPILVFIAWFAVSIIAMLWVSAVCIITNNVFNMCDIFDYGFNSILIGKW